MAIPYWCRILNLDNTITEISLQSILDKLGIKYKKIIIAKDSPMTCVEWTWIVKDSPITCAGWAWIGFDNIEDIIAAKDLFHTSGMKLLV